MYLCNNTPKYNGMMVSNYIKDSANHITLESRHEALEEILNRMVKANPDERPQLQELIELFGNLMKNPIKRQKLLLNVANMGLQ